MDDSTKKIHLNYLYNYYPILDLVNEHKIPSGNTADKKRKRDE